MTDFIGGLLLLLFVHCFAATIGYFGYFMFSTGDVFPMLSGATLILLAAIIVVLFWHMTLEGKNP